jgi:hypothetical protein
MPPESAPKQLSSYQPKGRRDSRRPRKRWLGFRGRNGIISTILADDDDDYDEKRRVLCRFTLKKVKSGRKRICLLAQYPPGGSEKNY